MDSISSSAEPEINLRPLSLLPTVISSNLTQPPAPMKMADRAQLIKSNNPIGLQGRSVDHTFQNRRGQTRSRLQQQEFPAKDYPLARYRPRFG
jgi:hypothetical protein